jgi:hypothetical protein
MVNDEHLPLVDDEDRDGEIDEFVEMGHGGSGK